jgi:predicted NodU family carbamoyl transferase
VYLLGIHNSAHDAAACLFRDYQLLAAVSLERLTRKKGAGVCVEQELPIPAIDECLAVAGIRRADVDVVCATRDHFEFQSYALRGRLRLKQQAFRLLRQKRLRSTSSMRTRFGLVTASTRPISRPLASTAVALTPINIDYTLIFRPPLSNAISACILDMC